MEIAMWLFTVAFAYGVGVFWYELLPGKLPGATWRVAAYPFALMVLAEAFIPSGPLKGPALMGVHPGLDAVAALIGVIIDWLVTTLRHVTVAKPETRGAPAHA